MSSIGSGSLLDACGGWRRGVDKWSAGIPGVGYSFIIQECLSSADLHEEEKCLRTERTTPHPTKIMARIITMMEYTNDCLREMGKKKRNESVSDRISYTMMTLLRLLYRIYTLNAERCAGNASIW